MNYKYTKREWDYLDQVLMPRVGELRRILEGNFLLSSDNPLTLADDPTNEAWADRLTPLLHALNDLDHLSVDMLDGTNVNVEGRDE